LLIYRWVFLVFLSRLRTYISVVGGAIHYNAEEYAKFRASNLVDSAIDYAFMEEFAAVDTIFTYHPQTLDYRLEILSSIAETTPPESYADLLPYVEPGEDTEVCYHFLPPLTLFRVNGNTRDGENLIGWKENLGL